MKNIYGKEIEKIKKEYLYIVVEEEHCNPLYKGNQKNTIELDASLGLSLLPHSSILFKALGDSNKMVNIQNNDLMGFYYEKELAIEHCKISNKNQDKFNFSRVVKIGSSSDETKIIPVSKEKNHLYVIWGRHHTSQKERKEADEEYWNEIIIGWLSMDDFKCSSKLGRKLHGENHHNEFIVGGGIFSGIYGIHTDCKLAREHIEAELNFRKKCGQKIKVFVTCIPMSKIKGGHK